METFGVRKALNEDSFHGSTGVVYELLQTVSKHEKSIPIKRLRGGIGKRVEASLDQTVA